MDYLAKAARVLEIEIFELQRLRDRLSENCRSKNEGEQRKSAHTGKYMHARCGKARRASNIYAADGVDMDGVMCGVAGGRAAARSAARLGPRGLVVCGGGDVRRGLAVL